MELGQPLEVLQPSVRDCGEAEVQPLELRQPLEVYQSTVGDLGVPQAQRLELGQPLEVLQAGVGDRRKTRTNQKIHPNHRFIWTLFVNGDPAPQLLDFRNRLVLFRLPSGAGFGLLGPQRRRLALPRHHARRAPVLRATTG